MSMKSWKRCGTEEFAAPELYGSNPYDIKKVDMFALAVITFIMLTGESPFLSSKDNDRHFALLNNNLK